MASKFRANGSRPRRRNAKDFVEEERKDAYFDFVVGGGEIDCDFPVLSFSFYVASSCHRILCFNNLLLEFLQCRICIRRFLGYCG